MNSSTNAEQAAVAAGETITIRGRCVVPGVAEGEALVTTEPISGWGGVDPRNGTVVAIFVICALTITGALVLIIDMDHPYLGFIQVSDRPLRMALERLGRP